MADDPKPTNESAGDSEARGRPSSSFTDRAADDQLAHQLSNLARSLEQEDDLQDTLSAIVKAAVETVPGAQHTSLSTVQNRRDVITRAATSQLAEAVDRAQYEAGEGPCLDTLYQQQSVRLPDLSSELRWPAFTAKASELGAASMLSVQLYVAGADLGALNLMSEETDAFTDESEHVALLFASHAAVAMAGAQEKAQILTAMDSRDLIGQAKGILIERFKITGDRAFLVLVRYSQASNRKLRDVAEELVTTGAVSPGIDARRR